MAVNWVQNPLLGRQTPFYQPEEQYDTTGSSWMGGVGADTQTPQVDSIFAPAQPGAAVGSGAALLGGDTGAMQPGNQQMDYPSADAIERRRKLAEALMGRQMEVNHPMQAIANAVSQISGAYLNRKADDDQKKYEQHRRDVYQQSFDAAGGDLDKLMAAWMKSGDPDLVDKAYDYQLKKMVASQQGTDAPETRNFYEGNEIVTKQWDPKSRSWVQAGTPSPRWKTGGGGGGGVGGIGGGGGGGGSYAPTAQGSTFMLSDGTIVSAPFQKGRGFIYRDKDGQYKDVPSDARPVTNSTGGMQSPQQWVKLRTQWQQEKNGLKALERYFQTVKDIPTGINRWALDLSAKAKTFIWGGKQLTPAEFNKLDAQAQAQALLGMFRTTIVGPGVMTEYDAVRVLNALGGDPGSALQNPQILYRVLSGLYERKYAEFKVLDEEIHRNGPTYGFDPDSEGAVSPTLDGGSSSGNQAAGGSQPAPVSRPAPPQAGQVVRGYRFKGGDPRDRTNWEKVR